MIRDVVMVQAICDRCNAVAEDYGHNAWANATQATFAAVEAGWDLIGGRLLCWQCTCWNQDRTRRVERVTP